MKYKGVRLEHVNLETDAYLEVPAVRRTFAAKNPQGVYAIPKTIRECDQLITIGPLAMNPLTGIGLSVSQYWDIAPRSVYGERREKLMALGDPVDVLTDLYLHQPASYALLGGAEHWDGMGRAVRHNIVIAGANAIAVDAVGAAVMGMNAAKVPLLDKLEIRGFGVAATDAIWTHGNEIEEARKTMEPPPGWRQA